MSGMYGAALAELGYDHNHWGAALRRRIMTDTATEILDRLERALRGRNRDHDTDEIEHWTRTLNTVVGDLYNATEEVDDGQGAD